MEGKGLIERAVAAPIIFLSRFFAMVLTLTTWCTVVLAVWAAMVIRMMLTVAFWNVINTYRGSGTVDTRRLEYVVMLWPKGVATIVGTLFGHATQELPEKQHFLELVLDTLLAMLFFTWMIFSLELAKQYVPMIAGIQDFFVPYFKRMWSAIGQILLDLYSRLF